MADYHSHAERELRDRQERDADEQRRIERHMPIVPYSPLEEARLAMEKEDDEVRRLTEQLRTAVFCSRRAELAYRIEEEKERRRDDDE